MQIVDYIDENNGLSGFPTESINTKLNIYKTEKVMFSFIWQRENHAKHMKNHVKHNETELTSIFK